VPRSQLRLPYERFSAQLSREQHSRPLPFEGIWDSPECSNAWADAGVNEDWLDTLWHWYTNADESTRDAAASMTWKRCMPPRRLHIVEKP